VGSFIGALNAAIRLMVEIRERITIKRGKTTPVIRRNMIKRNAPTVIKAYIDFKKRSNTLKSRLKDLDQIKDGFSQKVKKKIMKNVDVLNLTLKKAGKKPKKKNYKKLTQEIMSFSKMLREASS